MKQLQDQLDFWLSKVTMYRLVTLGLAVILGVSGVLALTGYFAFSIVSLLTSIAILVGATYVSGRLLGWLFGVRPHGESSVITGLILACLFVPPELAIFELVKLGLIGIFASASKYLLTIRGRHIFNPAAAATVIAGIVGIGFAGWWVATPALLPVTFLVGFLILRKTRTALVSGLFVGVAASLVTFHAMLSGLELGQGMWLAFASWPILFLGAVMLSEPLTQPPRRWQQLLIAVVVAVLMTMPVRTPFIELTPALALIIGNFIAWWWGARRALQLTFVEKIQLTPSSYEFVFTGTVPFTAGQYLEFTLPHKAADNRGSRRVFTIATNPTDKTVRFGIKFYPQPSTFKQTLKALQPGTVVAATRVAGDFTLPKDINKPLLFVAGGIGITPFVSLLKHLQATGEKRDITLMYAVAASDEIAYKHILEASGVSVIVVVPGGKATVAKQWQVIDAPFLSHELLQKSVPDIASRTVFISGAPLMVNAVARAAKELKVRVIKTDHFTGY